MHGAAVNLSGTLAALIGVTTSVPQLWRLLRTRDVAGLSLLSNLLGALAAGSWLAYGVRLADGRQLVANLPCLLGAVAIVALVVVQTRHAPWWLAAVPVAWLLVALACDRLGGVSALGMAATVVGLAARLPQIRAVVVGEDVAGLSVPSQVLALASAALWFVYGVGRALTPVALSSGLAMLLIVSVIVPAVRTAHTSARPAATPRPMATV